MPVAWFGHKVEYFDGFSQLLASVIRLRPRVFYSSPVEHANPGSIKTLVC